MSSANAVVPTYGVPTAFLTSQRGFRHASAKVGLRPAPDDNRVRDANLRDMLSPAAIVCVGKALHAGGWCAAVGLTLWSNNCLIWFRPSR